MGAINSPLPGSDPQDLGGHPDGSVDSEILILGSVDEVGADCDEYSE